MILRLRNLADGIEKWMEINGNEKNVLKQTPRESKNNNETLMY